MNINFGEKYFGKDIDQLAYPDLESFFAEEREESNKLELKAFSSTYGNINKNLEGVIRGICAFLNSDGGILVWGAPEGQKIEGRDEKVFMGDLSPLTERLGKDWLINKVSDSITPLPVNVRVGIVESEGKFVYVFEVQASQTKPHQYKNTYWVRLDGQTKPAPHYLIEALMKQIHYPNLEGYIKFDKIDHNGTNYFLDITIVIFNFSELQNDEDVSFRLMCPQGIFAGSMNSTNEGLVYAYEGHQLIHKDLIKTIHYGGPNKHHAKLIFNPVKLSGEMKNTVNLMLTFGGRKSPMKSSDYTLDMSKIQWDNKENPNYLIQEADENVLFSELQNRNNTTKKDQLKGLLGRDVN